MQELEPVQRALVVSPHPDDAEFGCGGTVARLTQMGKEVCYLVATNGNKGGRDTDMTADYLVNTRQDEQRRAAEVLGVSARTVKSDWRFARAWLHDRLGGDRT